MGVIAFLISIVHVLALLPQGELWLFVARSFLFLTNGYLLYQYAYRQDDSNSLGLVAFASMIMWNPVFQFEQSRGMWQVFHTMFAVTYFLIGFYERVMRRRMSNV